MIQAEAIQITLLEYHERAATRGGMGSVSSLISGARTAPAFANSVTLLILERSTSDPAGNMTICCALWHVLFSSSDLMQCNAVWVQAASSGSEYLHFKQMPNCCSIAAWQRQPSAVSDKYTSSSATKYLNSTVITVNDYSLAYIPKEQAGVSGLNLELNLYVACSELLCCPW